MFDKLNFYCKKIKNIRQYEVAEYEQQKYLTIYFLV